MALKTDARVGTQDPMCRAGRGDRFAGLSLPLASAVFVQHKRLVYHLIPAMLYQGEPAAHRSASCRPMLCA